MMKKATDFLKRSLDYPIYVRDFSPQEPNLDYYIDLASSFDIYPSSRIVCDDEGIAQFDYSRVPPPNNAIGLQHNFTYICWYALACLQDYLERKKLEDRERFLRQAQWLLKNKTVKDGIVRWEIKFPWNVYGVDLAIPWVSSMDQGLAMSVLIRAYMLTGQNEYLETAIGAGNFYDLTLEDGGFKAYLRNGSIFYEMYPSRPLSLILDGHIFSFMGLYDLYFITSDKKTKERFEFALKTVIDNLDYRNYRDIWSWFGCYYLSPPMYHKINLCWLKILAEISGEKEFFEIAEKWMRAYRDKRLAFNLKYKILLSSRAFHLGNICHIRNRRDRIK
jgi:hypothetical protein